MKKLIFLLIVLFPLIGFSADNSDSNDIFNLSYQDFNTDLSIMGVSYKQNGNQVTILINEQKALQSIPSLQQTGDMNPDITQTEINEYPHMYAGLIGLFNAATIVQYIYKNSNSDSLRFKGLLAVTNDYGNNEDHQIFSFNFDRKLYNKINWSNFPPSNLPKVVYSFKSSEWFAEQAN